MKAFGQQIDHKGCEHLKKHVQGGVLVAKVAKGQHGEEHRATYRQPYRYAAKEEQEKLAASLYG